VGQTNHGSASISIGYQITNTYVNTIVLSALNSGFTSSAPNSFYVGTMNSTNSSAPFSLVYNTATSEILYNTTKTFIINHPINKDKYLVHACLEGPEVGVYYRGEGKITNNHYTTVFLPDYVDNLATDFTVQITPIYNGKLKMYSATEVIQNSFNVYGENGNFFWVIHGSRGNINIEPNKKDVIVKGKEPYLWI